MALYSELPPGGGARGLAAISGSMAVRNVDTCCCGTLSFGSTAACTSLLAGMPRSPRSIVAASTVFTHQLMKETAVSGSFVRDDTVHSIDALYQAFRSVAVPTRLGKR